MSDYINPRSRANHGEHTWCVQCERVQLTAGWVANDRRCPTSSCQGNAIDACAWQQVCELKRRHPETPEVGNRYSFSDPNAGL